jgi:type IV secretory pathway VirB2 component (pilin)
MKKILAILLIILLGIALGFGVAQWRLRAASWNPAIDAGGQEASP